MKDYKVLFLILNKSTNMKVFKYLTVYADNADEVKDNIELGADEEMLEYEIVNTDGKNVIFLNTSTGIEYPELLEDLENIVGKEVNLGEIETIFNKYGWIEMGLSDNELIYIESPMGKEIDLIVEETDNSDTVIIKSIKKKYFY